VIFPILHISISVSTAAFALSLYRFHKGGLLASSWLFLIVAAALQVFAGVGGIMQLAGNVLGGEMIAGASNTLSVLMLLVFTVKYKRAWARLRV